MRSLNNNAICYELYAQNRGDEVILRNLQQNNFLVRKACELIHEKEVLTKLPKEHVAIIQAIAAMEMEAAAGK